MNKLLITMVVHLSMLLAATKAPAQDNFIVRNNRLTLDLKTVADKVFEVPASIQPVTISDRVSKKFARQFGNITDAVWRKFDDGYEVRFTSHGIDTRVSLTKGGNYYSRVRYYTEKELPTDIRHQVRSTYYDFAITSVQEVEYDHKTAYLVTITDAKSWKVIRIVDGESDVWEAHMKG